MWYFIQFAFPTDRDGLAFPYSVSGAYLIQPKFASSSWPVGTQKRLSSRGGVLDNRTELQYLTEYGVLELRQPE